MGIIRKLAGLFKTAAPTVTTSIVVSDSRKPASSDAPRAPMAQTSYGRMWDIPDADAAMNAAETGNFTYVAMMCDAMRGDGLIRGLLGTRGAGMVALPKLYKGDPWVVDKLRGSEAVYDEATGACLKPGIEPEWERIMPRPELVAIIEDGIMASAGVGYLDDDPTPGGWRKLRHLDLHFLTYEHGTDSWWYQDAKRGRLRVTPGDGRWVLFLPYGEHRPWTRGAWFACARPFCAKFGATIDRTRWARHLADALRFIETNEDANEANRASMERFILHWKNAPGLVLPKGYKPGIAESTGAGYEVYCDTEDRADKEIMVAMAGQTVTTEGTTGFGSGNIHRDIAGSLIQTMADAASEWLGVQILDIWTAFMGLGKGAVRVAWDARDPSQRAAVAAAAKAAAEGLAAVDKSVEGRGKRANAVSYFLSCGVSVELEDLPGAVPELPAQNAPPALPGASPVPLLPAAGDADEAPSDMSAQCLADVMTEHGVSRCEHDKSNRCQLCGIERERVLIPGKDGEAHTWGVKWRPIANVAAE